ncbi:MAG: hypothetical protein KKG70_04775 [Proteobacteria bacterium]|nr:hypothetical protein [Pseudomonadota bacterium]
MGWDYCSLFGKRLGLLYSRWRELSKIKKMGYRFLDHGMGGQKISALSGDDSACDPPPDKIDRLS